MLFRSLVLSLAISSSLFAAISPRSAAWKDEAWLASEEGKSVTANILTWQNDDGGWPKNYDASLARPAEKRDYSTIDNGGTHSELRLLARAHSLDPKPEYKAAFERGLHYLLSSQYPNGGFPQRFPLEKPGSYSRHITYNDGAMLGAMRLLESIRNHDPAFALVSDEDRARCIDAFNRGIDVVLKTQIVVEGKLTGWCQQHDAETLLPTAARKFELVGIASGESAGLAMLLMTQPEPDARMRAAIEGAAAWFEATRITGHRYDEVKGPQYEGGEDRILVEDPAAPNPIWARFYEIGTNRPFFCGRDGVIKYDLREVEHERRVGYAWYGRWPQRALDAYAKWKSIHDVPSTQPGR